MADVVFGNHGAGVGFWRRGSTSPGPDPENTQNTVYKKSGPGRREKSHQNQKLNSGKICFLFFFSKRQKATNSSGPELPRSRVVNNPKTQLEGWGARRGELFTKSALDGRLSVSSSLPLPPALPQRRLVRPGLCRQAQLLPLQDFGDIEVEEIAVEDCLDQASNDGDEVKEALEVVAPDPIEEIECTVDTQCKQVMAGDGLRLTRLAHHEQLWQDSH